MPNFDAATPLPPLEDPSFNHAGNHATSDFSPTEDPNKPAWGIGGALLVWIASIVLVLFMPLLFLIPYASYKGIHFGGADYFPALVQFATNDKTALLLQIIALFPTHLLTFLMVWALITRFGRRSFWAAIGWEWTPQFPWWLEVLISVMLGVVLFAIGSLIAKLFGAEQPTQLEMLINSSLAARYAISFLAVFTAPFAEELVYRGMLFAPLERRAGTRSAVVIVLALFTLIHVPQYWPNLGVIAAVALLSIVLTLVRAYSGRLLPCIVIHFVFNGIQAILLVLEPFVRRLLPTPQQLAPTAGVLLTLINFRF